MEHSNKRCTAIRRLNNELKKIDKKYIVEPFNTSEDNSFIRLNVRYNNIKYNIFCRNTLTCSPHYINEHILIFF